MPPPSDADVPPAAPSGASAAQPTSDGPVPIFVGGTGRSGTSIFTRLLGTHREVAAIPTETNLVRREKVRHFPRLCAEARPLARTVLIALQKQLWMTRIYRYTPEWAEAQGAAVERGLFGWLPQEALLERLPLLDALARAGSVDEAYRLYGRFLGAVLGMRAEIEGKPRWAEKTPPNALHADFLARCFADLRLVNLVRDGRDVACSLQDQPWGVKGHEAALDWWAENLRAGDQAMRALGDGQRLDVMYEQLIFDTETVLRRVAAFLGIGWDDRWPEFELRRDSVGRWRREMPEAVQAYARERYGDLLGRWDEWHAEREPA